MNFFSISINALPISLCLLLLSSGSTPIAAKEVAGAQIAATYQLDSGSLVLNGSGVRSKFFMDLYVASLYLPQAETKASSVLESPVLAIQLDILSSMITSEKMNDAINEGFDNATHGQTQAIAPSITQFLATFDAPIKVADKFVFVMQKDKGVSSIKNGITQGEIQDEAFRRALIAIWLGDEPAQASLKDAMLGID
ncbi:chalcone isomerase family protein [Shewanella sp. SR44-3]|uniref:chalcone isomerase family protein n=1 Tax=unclassified Shewanella TaxID=196818 RepID=UPI0015FA752F|nr:chalcone isomerase family protein [Shewanella sp. SR44-3]MBB1268114.1 chalcone isomerase family protein [Shewanella sp. SR44-3]